MTSFINDLFKASRYQILLFEKDFTANYIFCLHDVVCVSNRFGYLDI